MWISAQSLPRYTCVTKQINPDLWINEFKRGLDTAGILTQDNEYHPLSISIFGILHYEHFLETGDSISRQHVINQYKYFLRTPNFIYTADSLGIGLPYLKVFKDLKPPWYSGMTQGVAMSFLLRYYLLSRDEHALTLVKKLAHFMIQPVDLGGTISRTHEGYTWIEEYPNSLKSPQVLNGFINGLIGLYEYIQFFPEDTLARRIHDECYQSMLNSIHLYDTHNWTTYNRRTTAVNNSYMLYEMAELEHLYEIYEEPQLRRQLMIWSYMGYNKRDTVLRFYLNKDYQFGIRMAPGGSVPLRYSYMFNEAGLQREYSLRAGKHMDLAKVPYEWRIKKTSLQFLVPTPTHLVKFRVDSAFIKHPPTILARNSEHLPVEVNITTNDYYVQISGCESFSTIEMKPAKKQRGTAKIESFQYFDSDNQFLPFFIFDFIPETVTLQKDSLYSIQLQTENICDLTLFYKYSDRDSLSLDKSHWMANQYIDDFTIPFKAPANGAYKFFYSFPFRHSKPVFKGCQISPFIEEKLVGD